MDENIREYDETYSERLINYSRNIEDDICSDVKEQVLNDIIPLTPNDIDSIDELVIKKMELEENIFPKLFNFNIKCIEYDRIYLDICERIENFYKAQRELELISKIPVKTKEESIRENRLKYYLNK